MKKLLLLAVLFVAQGICVAQAALVTKTYLQTSGGSLPTAGWTAVNSAVLNNFSSLVIGCSVSNNAAVSSFRFCTQTLPARPYTVTAQVDCRAILNINTQTCGLYLYDGTKIETFENISQSTAFGLRVTTDTVNNGGTQTTLAGPTTVQGQLVTLKIVDNSTFRTFYYYSAGTFVQFYQETSNLFLTPTSVGFGGVAQTSGATPVDADLLYWSVTTP